MTPADPARTRSGILDRRGPAHEFDPVSAWCLRCGCGEFQHKAAEGGLACTRAENVVAISHIVRTALLHRLLRNVLRIRRTDGFGGGRWA